MRRKGFCDNCESSFSAANKQESSVLRDNERENWLDDITGRDVDLLNNLKEWQVPNDQISSLSAIDQFLHKMSILDYFWRSDLVALFMEIGFRLFHAS